MSFIMGEILYVVPVMIYWRGGGGGAKVMCINVLASPGVL